MNINTVLTVVEKPIMSCKIKNEMCCNNFFYQNITHRAVALTFDKLIRHHKAFRSLLMQIRHTLTSIRRIG